jgi:alpha-mannosidase
LSTNLHIINHTHWDREWFLTSIYTSRWIPGLIDSLERRVAANPGFRFMLDGQTLVVEDLLEVQPRAAGQVQALISRGNLTIGPYYCQPDWQLSAGELLIHNLIYGQRDMRRFGGRRPPSGWMQTGWLVDVFGHISQAPQIHRLFGIQALYVWRGVPRLEPYFNWEGADGSRVLTINLFGGYRNLYGVTHAPEVAVKRLLAEIDKLRPFYPSPDIPLFDGYDLEADPEDPLPFYAQSTEIGPELKLLEATPQSFANHIAQQHLPLPTLQGELNSGKYGATFPGVFSTRTYLKIMAYDCQSLLYARVEPLAALAYLGNGFPYPADRIEGWGRKLLQNAVHDCICGVSIDQVHEKMEISYRRVFDELQEVLRDLAGIVLGEFAPGLYAVSTDPFEQETWQVAGGALLQAHTYGVGVWPVIASFPVQAANQPVGAFTWRNSYYEAHLGPEGLVHIGKSALGRLEIYADEGDAYSDEPGERLGALLPHEQPVVIEKSSRHCVVAYGCEWRGPEGRVTARVRIHFDPSPLVRWEIDLDSHGASLRVEMVFETGLPGAPVAGMPFDLVTRPEVDIDLLPRQLSPELENVLLGQRELDTVTCFPFQDVVGVSGPGGTAAVLAKGLHACSIRAGTIRLTLRRTLEWLTRSNLPRRVGDAGPSFYVPDALCERQVRHELACMTGALPIDSIAFQRQAAAFMHPPLIVRSQGSGERTSWRVLQEDLPLSSLQIQDGALLARFYNPSSHPQALSRPYSETDVWGQVQAQIREVAPKHIATLLIQPVESFVGGGQDSSPAVLELLTSPAWRVEKNHGSPDPTVLAELEAKISALSSQIQENAAELSRCQGAERLRRQHRGYMLERERLELQLSLLLNRRKLEQGGVSTEASLYRPDEEIAALGAALNRMRIQRRIFDYVVQVL